MDPTRRHRMLPGFRVAAAAVLLAGNVRAVQVVHMDLMAVLPMADCVVLAVALSVERTPQTDFVEVVGAFRRLEVLMGAPAPDSCFRASCSVSLPRLDILEDGTEIWEWPLVFGSGLELVFEPGDTVVALLGVRATGDTVGYSLIRLEPAGSLPLIPDPATGHD